MDTLIPLDNDWRPADPRAAAPLEKGDRLLTWGLGAFFAVDLAIFLYVAAKGFVRQPYSDMFAFLRAEFDWERSGDLLGYLTSLHNSQHLVWVRVLTALDVQVFHGGAVVFLAAACLSTLAAGALVAAEIFDASPVRAVGAMGALLAAPLVVSTVNAMDCTQPINVVYPLAVGFAILAVLLFERAEASGRAILLTVASLAAGLCAAAGSAAGAAVFPALIVSAVRHPAHRPMTAPILVIGLAALAAVVTPLMGAQPGQAATTGLGHVWKIAQYFLVYAGMPWSAIGGLSRIRLAIGLVTVIVGLALLWRGSHRVGAAGRLERVGLDLILFALITAAMAAVGRVDEAAAVIVPVRYAIFMSAFQVGLICLLAPAVAERWADVRRYAVPAALAAGLALLAQQAAAASGVLRTSQMIRAEIAAFDAGVRRPEMRQMIYPDFAAAVQVEAECRRRGLCR